MQLRNILVAIDFDGQSQELIDTGASLAGKYAARLWIVHIAAPEPDFVGYDVGPQYIRDMKAEDLRDEHLFLQKEAEWLRSKDIATEALLIQGSTVKTILEEAEKLDIDLLVVGSHEHSFLYNTFAENTAMEIFKQCKIPMLTLPLNQTDS